MYPDRDYYRPAGFGGFSFFPPVIKNLLIINIVVFFVNNVLLSNFIIDGMTGDNIVTKYFALIPLQGITMGITADGEIVRYLFYPWQLITYQFLHGGFSHIFFNMFALWMFGMEIENIWGSKKFLIFYTLCGVGGAVIHLIVQLLTGHGAPTVGASGAIYGVMVAFAMMFPDRYIFIYFLIPVKAKYLIAFFVVLEFFSAGDPSVVAHLVHIGGAITAFTYILVDRKRSFNLSELFGNLRKSGGSRPTQFRRKPRSSEQVEDAEYYEINSRKKEGSEITQEEIDRILDKISRSGYQNLTEREKKILFEASKRS